MLYRDIFSGNIYIVIQQVLVVLFCICNLFFFDCIVDIGSVNNREVMFFEFFLDNFLVIYYFFFVDGCDFVGEYFYVGQRLEELFVFNFFGEFFSFGWFYDFFEKNIIGIDSD